MAIEDCPGMTNNMPGGQEPPRARPVSTLGKMGSRRKGCLTLRAGRHTALRRVAGRDGILVMYIKPQQLS